MQKVDIEKMRDQAIAVIDSKIRALGTIHTGNQKDNADFIKLKKDVEFMAASLIHVTHENLRLRDELASTIVSLQNALRDIHDLSSIQGITTCRNCRHRHDGECPQGGAGYTDDVHFCSKGEG